MSEHRWCGPDDGSDRPVDADRPDGPDRPESPDFPESPERPESRERHVDADRPDGPDRGDGADRRGPTVLRRLGLAALGLLGGLLGGIVVQDLVAPLLVTENGEVSVLGLILLPLLIPVCGAAGAVIAVLLDTRATSTRHDG